jgi:GT2 family glycosyltransferase
MISIIIPNFNGEENLKNNLPKIVKTFVENSNYEIVISDDASQDSSVEVINNFSKNNPKTKLKLITNEKNKGFSTNVNRAVSKATGEILVLLNTDVYPKNNFLELILKDFEDKEVFGIGFMDESIENGRVVLRGRGVGQWRRGFLVHNAGDLDKKNNLWASGGSSAFRKDVWNKLGGLNEIYNPFYWEDIDLSYRALMAGYKILFEKSAVVVHEHEKGIIMNKFSKSQITSLAFRNQFIFTWINGRLTDIFLNLIWLPYNMIKSLISGEYEFILGILNALALLPWIVKSRIRVHRLFVKKESEIIITQ